MLGLSEGETESLQEPPSQRRAHVKSSVDTAFQPTLRLNNFSCVEFSCVEFSCVEAAKTGVGVGRWFVSIRGPILNWVCLGYVQQAPILACFHSSYDKSRPCKCYLPTSCR